MFVVRPPEATEEAWAKIKHVLSILNLFCEELHYPQIPKSWGGAATGPSSRLGSPESKASSSGLAATQEPVVASWSSHRELDDLLSELGGDDDVHLVASHDLQFVQLEITSDRDFEPSSSTAPRSRNFSPKKTHSGRRLAICMFRTFRPPL